MSTKNVSNADNQQGRSRLLAGNPQRLQAEHPRIDGMDLNEVNLLGILYTDGCLSPRGKNGWRLYLSNTSWQIITVFKDSLINLFNLPKERIRISQLEINGKPFYKAIVDDMRIGQILTNRYGTFRTLKYKGVNGQFYPQANLPDKLFQDNETICQFLKVAFSCDGGINLYVAKSKYKWLIRNVYLACKHPILIKQYQDLLKQVGIRSKLLLIDGLLRIQGKQYLKKFADKIGFVDGVEFTQHSAYWQGFTKQKVLQLAVTSYGNPKIIFDLPQFRVKI